VTRRATPCFKAKATSLATVESFASAFGNGTASSPEGQFFQAAGQGRNASQCPWRRACQSIDRYGGWWQDC
jgi:hypothetical protein